MGIREYRDSQNLSYILPTPDLFYQTGYKVLLSQEKNGFIRCAKTLHNGDTKLLYDISRYKSLDSLLSELKHDAFLAVLRNLADVVIEVKNNGFMQCENIETSLDKIFIDSNNYKVSLVYLPISTLSQPDSFIVFENKLKSNILAAISNYPNLMSAYVGTLCEYLKSPVSTIEQLRELLNSGSGQLSSLNSQLPQGSENCMTPDYKAREYREYSGGIVSGGGYACQPSDVSPQQSTKAPNPKKGGFFGLFASKQNKPPVKAVYQANDSGATEILDDLFMPSIMLVGVKTPVKVEIVINKEDFIIGKKFDSVDGLIQFNKAISRIHCKIIFSGKKYFITDLSSSNGTYVNGARIEPNRQVGIAPGDKIRLANSDFIIKSI